MRERSSSLLRTAASVLFFAVASWFVPVNAAASAATIPQVDLCSVAVQVTSLRVSRGIPMNRETFSFPRLDFVKNEVAARSVAAALCALPPMPTGAIYCPADFGPMYSLLFSVAGSNVTDVRLDATGCEEVSGLGAIRWLEENPRLFRVLGAAMSLKSATQSTFEGRLVTTSSTH